MINANSLLHKRQEDLIIQSYCPLLSKEKNNIIITTIG
jgi:hypothetical protein